MFKLLVNIRGHYSVNLNEISTYDRKSNRNVLNEKGDCVLVMRVLLIFQYKEKNTFDLHSFPFQSNIPHRKYNDGTKWLHKNALRRY